MNIQEMLRAHPSSAALDRKLLDDAISELLACAWSCTACADACIAEDTREWLVRCVRLTQDCADVCETTARVLSRQTLPDFELVEALADACRIACHACDEECTKHVGYHEHCRLCAEACRSAEEMANAVVQAARGKGLASAA